MCEHHARSLIDFAMCMKHSEHDGSRHVMLSCLTVNAACLTVNQLIGAAVHIDCKHRHQFARSVGYSRQGHIPCLECLYSSTQMQILKVCP